MRYTQLVQSKVILDRIIRQILSRHFDSFREKDRYYNFRCNICGDSKKSNIKRRGYILKNDDSKWTYYCHNCPISMSVFKWMKTYFPEYHRQYISEVLSNQRALELEQQREALKPSRPVVKKKKVLTEDEKKNDTKFWVPIKKGQSILFDKAIRVCVDRHVPSEVWEKWFVGTDGRNKNRLIIPFYNHLGKIYFWQGRALKDWLEPKYLSREDPNDSLNSIYNYYNIDVEKPTIIFEGPIDSIFVENAIGLTGLKLYDKRLQKIKHKYFILDNDEAGREQSIKLLKTDKAEYVFVWKKFLKDMKLPVQLKDMNDVIVESGKYHKFTFEELKPYFTKSKFDTIWFV